MAIERGAEWGWAGRLPPTAPVATDDASLAELIRAGLGFARLTGGDLARTLGIRADTSLTEITRLLPIDAIELRLDGGQAVVCAAHAVVGSLTRSGEVVAVMNAAFLGPLNLAPRAHPGDGLADVVTLRLRPADRLKARRRMPTGTHVPHPGISIRRIDRGTVELTRPGTVRVDGRRIGRASRLEFRVHTGAITVGV